MTPHASLQGRPLSSFAHRDINLHQAAPSVLHSQADQSPEAYFGAALPPPPPPVAALSITAPRHVYSTFSDVGWDTAYYSPQSELASPSSPPHRTSHPASPGSLGHSDSARGARVKFNSPRSCDVREFMPSPRGSTFGNVDLLGSPPATTQLEHDAFAPPLDADSLGFISRRASNMRRRAGTFDEVYGVDKPPSPSAMPVTRRRSSAARGHGASWLPDVPAGAPDAASGGAVSDLSDALPSRRASNMSERAGTFDELVDVGGEHAMYPASLRQYTLPVVVVSAGGAGDAGGAWYAMQPCDTPEPTPQLSLRPSVAEEDEPAVGGVSRRYTNMATAAGPFDELVDDDGDVLDDDVAAAESRAAADAQGDHVLGIVLSDASEEQARTWPRSTQSESVGGRTTVTVSMRGLVEGGEMEDVGASDERNLTVNDEETARRDNAFAGFLMSPLPAAGPERGNRGGVLAVGNFLSNAQPASAQQSEDVLAAFGIAIGVLPSDGSLGGEAEFDTANPSAPRGPDDIVGLLPSDALLEELELDAYEGNPVGGQRGDSGAWDVRLDKADSGSMCASRTLGRHRRFPRPHAARIGLAGVAAWPCAARAPPKTRLCRVQVGQWPGARPCAAAPLHQRCRNEGCRGRGGGRVAL